MLRAETHELFLEVRKSLLQRQVGLSQLLDLLLVSLRSVLLVLSQELKASQERGGGRRRRWGSGRCLDVEADWWCSIVILVDHHVVKEELGRTDRVS